MVSQPIKQRMVPKEDRSAVVIQTVVDLRLGIRDLFEAVEELGMDLRDTAATLLAGAAAALLIARATARHRR